MKIRFKKGVPILVELSHHN